MTIEHITTHKEQMLARLMFAFRGKPNIIKLLTVIAARYQGIEDALWQLLSQRGIETGEGAQLDVIGRIIGQEREDSADDDAYRLRLKARMRANQSSGTVPDILDVFATLLAGYEDLHLTQYFPATILLTIDDVPITEATAILYASFLEAAKVGGVRAFVLTSELAAEETFAFPASTVLTADHDGAPTMYVASTAGFRDSGSLLFDAGGPSHLRNSYSSKTATTFEGVVEEEGATGNRATGYLVVQAPHPTVELTGSFDATIDVTLPIGDTSDFPDEGFVAVGPMSALTEYRIVEYTGKTATHLTGVSDTGVGGETTFLAAAPVAWIGRSFGQDGETFGGVWARVVEA